MPFQFPFRQIHLDFHTSPFIPGIGSEFDAKTFVQTMKRAHVNSVTVFAKCHHGHLYYDTKHEARHPHLKPGLNMLGEQVEALHREGIRAPIYISVQCDEYAADTRPEWIAREPDGKPVGAGPYSPGWQILDMNSPYQDYLAEQTAEILKLFKPVDGIFFDMCWDQSSSSNYAVESMLKRGLNPEDQTDRGEHSRWVAFQYMDRFYKMVKENNSEATVAFNSRALSRIAEEVRWLGQVEIEALPTGGWGYMYFPKFVRSSRHYGLPYMGMTARFHKSWADFGGLKPRAALEYETMQMLAHGAACSIGDQMHPRGTLDPAAYDLIGKVYARVESLEPFVRDAQSVTQIGVFAPLTGGYHVPGGGTDEGVVRALQQLQHQFDFLDASIDPARLSKYDLVILADAVDYSGDLKSKVDAYVKQGGKLLCTGLSGLSADAKHVLCDALPIIAEGISPFLDAYVRITDDALNRDVPRTDHVTYDRGTRVKASSAGTSLARVVDPYFDRSWKHFSSHFQTPPDKESGFDAVVVGKNFAYVSIPLFASFGQHGSAFLRTMLRNLLDRLLPEPIVRVNGAPTGLEATLSKQGPRTIAHLLYYVPERRTPKLDLIDDVVPIHGLTLDLRWPGAKPARVTTQPDGKSITEVTLDGGRLKLKLPPLVGHTAVVIE
jgi:hypothetical protein